MHCPEDPPADNVPCGEADGSSAKNEDAPIIIADTASVLALIEVEERKLRHSAYSVTRCYEASKNIVSDLKIRMLEREGRHRFNDRAHLRAHVYTVVRNLALDWVKHRNRQINIVFCHDPHAHAAAQSEEGALGYAYSHTALLEALKPYLRELTEKERAVFDQRFLGLDFADIADLLGISEATAKKHHSNALRKLRRTDLREALS